MNPCVLVISYGNLSAMKIVENILTEINQPKVITPVTYESLVINHYKCDIRTKYYNTSVYLVPFDGTYDEVPTELRNTTESLIVYFEPNDKSFINNLSGLNDFIITNKIQLGFLITTAFSGKPNELTFEDLKEKANIVFDVITLKEEDEEHSEDALCETDKYSEIVEGLKNFVWSNIKTKASTSNCKQPNNAEDLENELNDFEKLLITAQNLRSDTRLTRDEILNKAEELAEVMSAILNDNDSD
ncbi:uncharacterized protein [Drosophila virilis]|uniref:Uncharacterized protein, isoform A n=1 Tax=Drosophila virilis TaxID=7244 RepID=B4LGG1_DROVI|nr:uncharacterized protein LOC6622906 [Drosophila virilis]EDW70490.1 uncharacterized protein Dvir_GJ13800, isoform A [Drosophila virilis]